MAMMERESRGPVEDQLPSIGECYGGETGVGGQQGKHPH